MARARSLLLGTLVVLVAALGLGACGGGESKPEVKVVDPKSQDVHYDYDYVIPFGTGHRIDGGEKVQIVPGTLDVKVGERIRIKNEDVRGAAVGIFWVPAGRTVAMQFKSPGTLSGQCDVHPSGVFTINVKEA